MQGPFGLCNWNEYNLNLLTSNNWRESLVPAAAVIPAPIAYIKVAAVKKLVVGLCGTLSIFGLPQGCTGASDVPNGLCEDPGCPSLGVPWDSQHLL